MTDDVLGTWACPKDGATMERRGRRAWRCPECGGLFIDVEAMRRRDRRLPVWLPFVWSLGLSVGLTLLIRRLRRRSRVAGPSAGDPAA